MGRERTESRRVGQGPLGGRNDGSDSGVGTFERIDDPRWRFADNISSQIVYIRVRGEKRLVRNLFRNGRNGRIAYGKRSGSSPSVQKKEHLEKKNGDDGVKCEWQRMGRTNRSKKHGGIATTPPHRTSSSLMMSAVTRGPGPSRGGAVGGRGGGGLPLRPGGKAWGCPDRIRHQAGARCCPKKNITHVTPHHPSQPGR